MASQRPIGFWFKLLDQLIDEQFDAILEEHGVTRRQWQLMNLLNNGEVSRAQIEEALQPFLSQSEPDALQEELVELVESGWVSQREFSFELTERGETSLTRLKEVVGRTRERLVGDIPVDEFDHTVDLLERMARNLGWTDPVPTESSTRPE